MCYSFGQHKKNNNYNMCCLNITINYGFIYVYVHMYAYAYALIQPRKCHKSMSLHELLACLLITPSKIMS